MSHGMESFLSRFEAARVAVVTGASRGLGLALASKLTSKGIGVIGLARSDRVQGSPGCSECESSGALWLDYYTCNVQNGPSVSETFETIGHQWGKIDVLVNNAGVGEFQPLDATSEELWKRTLDTNLTGAFFCTRAALPLFRRAGGGLIINVCSIAAVQGIKNLAAYSASKAGLLAFGRSVAEELRAENIHVCNVLAGAIATDFWEQAGEASNWDRAKMIPVEDAAQVLADIICAYPRVVVEEIRLLPPVGML